MSCLINLVVEPAQHLCLDRFFEKVIQDSELVKLIKDSGTATMLDVRLHTILNDLGAKYPQAFTKQMLASIKDNVGITHLLVHQHDRLPGPDRDGVARNRPADSAVIKQRSKSKANHIVYWLH